MDSSIKLLLTINDSVKDIIMEIKILKELTYFINFDLHIYEEALQVIDDKIEIFNEAFTCGILQHRSISLSILNILNLKLNEIQSLFKKIKLWHTKITDKKFSKLFTFFTKKPSKIKNLLESKLNCILPYLYEIQDLEKNIFGSAIRIKQPVLQKAWMLVGSNQLNDSYLSKNLFCENLFMLLKSEGGGGELNRKDYWKEKIKIFVYELDGIACTDPDDKLSIAELNEIPQNMIHIKSVMDLLLQNNSNSTNNETAVVLFEQNANEIIKEIPINFNNLISVSHNNPITIPTCTGYGANWPSKLCCEFVIPNLSNDKCQLFSVKIICIAFDQKWGGTGHSQVRYQINEYKPKTAFSINVEKHPDNNYEIMISGDKVKVGDVIKIWACCPPWNGWEINVEKINVFSYYS
jgi:hypothetical protein